MKYSFCWMFFLLAVVANGQADSNHASGYLKPNVLLYSPNKKYVCWAERLEENGVRLMVRENTPDGISKSLWTSTRTIGAQWSPNSRWLAINDNYLASESAVLIFDLCQMNSPLVFQTPLSKTDQDAWSIMEWNIAKKQVRLKRIRRWCDKPHFETVTLETKSVEPTLYRD